MEQRIYHGNITINDISQALTSGFNRGNYQVQEFQSQNRTVIQIATVDKTFTDGATSLTISLEQVADGVSVSMGTQNWLGTAASIGQTAVSVLMNPWNILNRLDDIAQDLENVQLSDRIWQFIDQTAKEKRATFELSEKLKRVVCSYCGSANPVGEASCIACGAPLGEQHPIACPHCGFVVSQSTKICPNCNKSLI